MQVSVTVSVLDKAVVVPDVVAHEYRLKEGTDITTAQLERLKAESELFLCDRAAARMLAAREHSTGEIRTKLVTRQFAPETVRRVIRKYTRQGVLDDAHLAHRLAGDLLVRRPCGRAYLMACLQRKKIDRSLAEQAADQALAGKDESELAVAALTSRWREYSQFELEVARRKSYNYLVRRGFGYEAARAAFEQLHEQEKEVPRD